MSDYNVQTVSQPQKISKRLFKHQLASIYKMEKLEREKYIEYDHGIKRTRIGINADITGYGKCHKADTPILMYNGSIKMVQHVMVGDMLMGDDSTPRRVLSLASGAETMYKIIPKTYGDPYIVNRSHILSLKLTRRKIFREIDRGYIIEYFNKDKLCFMNKVFLVSYRSSYSITRRKAMTFFNYVERSPIVDIPLLKYLHLPEKIQKVLCGYKVSVNFKESILFYDPYYIGIWFGIEFSSIHKINKDVIHHYNILKTSYDFQKIIKKSIINHNICIPTSYKINSKEKRLQLLAGIIDSIGVVNMEERKYIIEIHGYKLADDIVFLGRSLGYCVTKEHVLNYTLISIKGFDLIHIPLKYVHRIPNNILDFNQDYLSSRITIHKCNADIYYGFSIDGNRRYLLGDFTVTHNTLSMMGLIARDKMKWDIDTPFVEETISMEACNLIHNHYVKRYDKLYSTLVLVSPSIVSQWENELLSTTLTYKTISSRRDIDKIEEENYDIIIVTISMYNDLVLAYKNYAWKRFIFDEPGHVRVPGMKSVCAGFYWFVTATPDAITYKHRNCRGSFMKNIIGDNWTDFNQQFAGMIIKNDEKFTKSSFSMPPTSNKYYKCIQPILKLLSGIVNDNIYKMLSAGNIGGVISALGGKKKQNIIDLVKTEKLEEYTKNKANIDIYSNIKKDNKKLNIALNKQKEIESQLDSIENRVNMLVTSVCPICKDNMVNPVLDVNCHNVFCAKCMITWLFKKENCPLCRGNLKISELVYLTSKEDNNLEIKHENELDTSTPLEKVIDIITGCKQGSKFIIFSSYDETFQPIQRILMENNISYTIVKGNKIQREKSIDNFKRGGVQVIFLNSNFNGAGINLEETTDIILYHNMSETTKNQIIGRANRIGRKLPLTVHHIQS